MPAPPAAPNIAPPTPPTGPYGEIHDSADEQDTTTTNTTDKNGHSHSTSVGRGYSYSYSSDGDSWAVVTGPNQHISFSGEWNGSTREAIEKARKMSSGKFLWFTHGGKSYMIDDPAVVAQIELMYKPMAEFGAQQEELGRQQEKLGHEQELLAKAQSLARVPTPDMSREIARVDEAMAKLLMDTDIFEVRGHMVEVVLVVQIEQRVGVVGAVGNHPFRLLP